MKLKWAKVSDQLQPLGKPFLCANAKGNPLSLLDYPHRRLITIILH